MSYVQWYKQIFKLRLMVSIACVKYWYLRSHLSVDLHKLSLVVLSWQRYCPSGGSVCFRVCWIVPAPHWLEHPLVSFCQSPNSQSSNCSINESVMEIFSGCQYLHILFSTRYMYTQNTWAILKSKYFSWCFFDILLGMYVHNVAVFAWWLVHKCIAQTYSLATSFAGFFSAVKICFNFFFIYR